MQKIVLKPNRQKDAGLAISKRVLEVLKRFCSEIYVENEYTELIECGAIGFDATHFPACDLIIVLGGDGSMLRAAADAFAGDIPMLGINMGRVGYLASLEPDEIDALHALFDGGYIVNEHVMLSVSAAKTSGEEVFLGYVLNDVVISGKGHLADMRLENGGHFLDYRADGLIAATPTGSTAYSFSAGGPVMEEGMDAICVTPVCPRSFFSRSLLFSPSAVLHITNTTTRGGDLDVSLDGCIHFPLALGESVTVRRAEKGVKILVLKPRNLLEVLHTKMDMRHF